MVYLVYYTSGIIVIVYLIIYRDLNIFLMTQYRVVVWRAIPPPSKVVVRFQWFSVSRFWTLSVPMTACVNDVVDNSIISRFLVDDTRENCRRPATVRRLLVVRGIPCRKLFTSSTTFESGHNLSTSTTPNCHTTRPVTPSGGGRENGRTWRSYERINSSSSSSS